MKNQDFCGLMHILKPSVPKKQQKQSKLEKVDKNFKMPRLDDILWNKRVDITDKVVYVLDWNMWEVACF